MDLGKPIPANEAANMPIGDNTAAHAPVVATDPGIAAESPDVPRPIPVDQVPDRTSSLQPHSPPSLPPRRPTSVTGTSAEATPVQPAAVQSTPQPPTATIDPNIPSSESAPTALPTNPATNPRQQQEALKHESPKVVARQVEKTKAAEREVKGEKPKGTIVHGLEDDRLYAMLRRFDTVSWWLMDIETNHADVLASHACSPPSHQAAKGRTGSANVRPTQFAFPLGDPQVEP